MSAASQSTARKRFKAIYLDVPLINALLSYLEVLGNTHQRVDEDEHVIDADAQRQERHHGNLQVI